MKQTVKNNRNRYEANKLTVSLVAMCLMIILIAALCSSGAKGSAEYLELIQGENNGNPQIPPEVNTEQTVEGTSSSNNNGFFEEETETVDTKQPNESVSVTERNYFGNEKYVGEYSNDSMSVEISKVTNGDVNFFICDIILSSPEQLKTAFAGGKITGRLFTSKIASSANAVFAVNGDFCGFRSDGIIIRNGKLYRNSGSDDWDLLYMNKNGELVTCLNDEQNGKDLVSEGAWQSWCFGPTLVSDYEALNKFNSPGLSSTHREPRTAIGQIDDLHYIILVVDAVRENNETVGGMSFATLAQTFEDLGCKTAYNLDGGGSTTLYFKGQVINEPCVNGERQISDIVYLAY